MRTGLSSSARLHGVAIATVVGLVSAMAISWPLWIGGRSIPCVPWIEGVPFLGAPWDSALLGALAGVLLSTAIRPAHRLSLGVSVVLCVAIGVQDVLRSQPWFFEYVLVLWLLWARAMGRPGEAGDRRTLRALCWLVAAVYAYSGISKCNHTYVLEVVPKMIEPFVHQNGPPGPAMEAAAWCTVALETLIGLGFLFARTRRAAVIAATLMHVGILVCLGPLGHNDNAVVWPWNVVMVAIVWLVAWRRDDATATVPPGEAGSLGLWQAPALIAGCVLPALGVVHAWPAYLSWNMYSGGEPEIALGLTTAAGLEAPASLKPYLQPIESGRFQYAVGLSVWIGGETRARAMPEEWYLRALCARLMRSFPATEGVVVVDLPRAPRWRGRAVDGRLTDRPKTQMSAQDFLTRQPAR